jgi:hypothetical protein
VAVKLTLWARQCLLDRSLLDPIQQILKRKLPRWCEDVRVSHDDETEEDSTRVEFHRPGSLYDALKVEAQTAPSPLAELVRQHFGDQIPYERTTAMVHLIGSDPSVEVFIDVDEYPLAPRLDGWFMGNRFAVSFSSDQIDGQTTAVLVRNAFEELVDTVPVDVGNARSNEEFRAKNMLSDANGVRAVGIDISRALPGLYWLNFFGQPYCELIGRDRLAHAPAEIVVEGKNGVLIGLSDNPDSWNTASYKSAEESVMNHLGRGYFFIKDEPDRRTVAPRFRTH